MSAAATPAEGPFNRRTVFWGIFASLFAAAGFFLLSTYAPDFRVGTYGGGSGLAESGIGFCGVAGLLSLTENAPILVRALEQFDSDALLIVPLPADIESSALDNLLEARRNRVTL